MLDTLPERPLPAAPAARAQTLPRPLDSPRTSLQVGLLSQLLQVALSTKAWFEPCAFRERRCISSLSSHPCAQQMLE